MNNKKNYLKIELIKKGMSQMFDDQSKVLPLTELKLLDESQLELIESIDFKKSITIEGRSKGKGFTGVMKRWGFSGGPETHGQKNHHRQAGSIGSQGMGRVMPGKKMAGRQGDKKTTVDTKFLGLNKDELTISVKGGVPGSRNSKVFMYIEKNEN